jgi:hypothetical protein
MNRGSSRTCSPAFALRVVRLARRGGQILLPSLLVIPSLLLFVYLLFETTKVSREKIREQFAIDSAAFIQMGDYTNLLNRTAYVDGAFPYRIFKEAYDCPNPEKPLQYTGISGQICPFRILYEAGDIPKYANDVEGTMPDDSVFNNGSQWQIGFDPAARPEFAKNPNKDASKPLLTLITSKQGVYNPDNVGSDVMLEWGTASGYFKFYSQVYALLGSVEMSQYTVFDRLTQNFNFFRKSFYLNANTAYCVSNPQACWEDGLGGGGGFLNNRISKGGNFFMDYVQKIYFYAKLFTGGSLPPYTPMHTVPAMDMTKMAPEGLFQLATVNDDILKTLGNGLEVSQGWDVPSNYFKVDLNTLGKCSGMNRPCVHATIATQCPQLANGNDCVWPGPTPKYQTRLYP